MAGSQYFDTTVTTDTTIVTTTETVVATLSGVTTGRKEDIRLTGNVQVATGGSTTALQVRIRRGTGITGTPVGEGNTLQVATAAGNTEEVSYTTVDFARDVSGESYVLTVTQVGAAANGSCLQASLEARVGK